MTLLMTSINSIHRKDVSKFEYDSNMAKLLNIGIQSNNISHNEDAHVSYCQEKKKTV